MAKMRYQQALATALRDAMLDDPSIFVVGEDVRQSLRAVTRGLHQEFGDLRILDAPLSEQGFTSFATGAALAGLRPVVEYQIVSLLYIAFEQIVNQAQKFRLMTGGQAGVPVTYLVPGSGARGGLAGQHSDNPYTMFVHAGVKTVVPSTAADAYGLLRTAIDDDDPVIFFAPASNLGLREEFDPAPIPLGVGRVHREGTDVTVLAVGHMVQEAILAADELAGEISVEVIDPRTLLPFDWELLRRSIEKTGRLVAIDDSNLSAGFSAEVVATAAETMPLVAPPRRVARADSVIPYAVGLEREIVPSKTKLVHAIRQTMNRVN